MGVHPVHEALVSKYIQDLIRIKSLQLHRRLDFRHDDLKDLQQQLAQHVLQKAHLFKPGRGKPVTFIAAIVKTGAAMMCRTHRRLKRGAGVRPQSLHGRASGQDEDGPTLSDRIQDSDRSRHRGISTPSDLERWTVTTDVSDLLAKLPHGFREIARLVANGASEPRISRQIGLPRHQVRKAKAIIRAMFQKAGME